MINYYRIGQHFTSTRNGEPPAHTQFQLTMRINRGVIDHSVNHTLTINRVAEIPLEHSIQNSLKFKNN